MIDTTRPKGYKTKGNNGSTSTGANTSMNAGANIGQSMNTGMGASANMCPSNNQSTVWTGSMAHGAVIGTRQNVELISDQEFNNYGVRVEIMEYQKLMGCTNIHSVQSMYFMSEANLKCRQIALYILNSGMKIESGAMSYFQGPLQVKAGITSAGKLMGQILTGKLTNEKIIMPEYSGSGVLVLEPSFKHFLVMELGQGESIICDKGMFFAASLSVNIEPTFAGGVSGSLLGGEGVFQQLITGPGVVILESPVPIEEINKVYLNNDILRVDGNFALLRTANIQMSVEMVSPSVIGSAASGEGLVNVYRGTGEVWLAPTIKVYDALARAYLVDGDLSKIDFNTSTGRAKTR